MTCFDAIAHCHLVLPLPTILAAIIGCEEQLQVTSLYTPSLEIPISTSSPIFPFRESSSDCLFVTLSPSTWIISSPGIKVDLDGELSRCDETLTWLSFIEILTPSQPDFSSRIESSFFLSASNFIPKLFIADDISGLPLSYIKESSNFPNLEQPGSEVNSFLIIFRLIFSLDSMLSIEVRHQIIYSYFPLCSLSHF